MNLTHEDVQEILRLLDASSFDELHLETDRFKLTLRRSWGEGWTQETQTLSTPRIATSTPGPHAEAAPAPGTHAVDTTVDPLATAPTAPATCAPSSAGAAIDVRTPIVGTFYRSPKPDSPPFVDVGSKVAADTVIGIVETMKLMNSVYAGVAGDVVEICVQSGQFVEQGQVVLRLLQSVPRDRVSGT